MTIGWKGVANVDIRDSVEDWPPFVSPAAPKGAPSVIYVDLEREAATMLMRE